jgi:hypothetical protein
MASKTLSVTEAVRHFSDYVNRVSYKHESFLLCRGKKAVAELRPVPQGRRLGDLPAIVAALPRLDRKVADDFIRDVEKVRAAMPREKVRDPWES